MEENREQNIEEKAKERYDMSGLQLAFYGLLFTAINIRIQGFDIVPDVVGYILVVVGLSRIECYGERFSSAKKVAFLLLALSLINIIQPPAQSTDGFTGAGSGSVTFSAGILGDNALLATLMMIVGLLANLYFVYSMCMGMKTLLLRVGDEPLAKICDDRWKLILAAEAGLLTSLILAMVSGSVGMILAMIFGALALVALVLFLLLIHHAYKSIHGKEAV